MNIAVTDKRKARVLYDDLREWIVQADKLGELVRASSYSWQEDISMAGLAIAAFSSGSLLPLIRMRWSTTSTALTGDCK